jgi:hypothetical protein
MQGQYFRIADSTVENSDSTYSSDVVAEGSLVLPDITVNVKNTLGTTVNTGSYPRVTDVDISAPDATINNSNNTFNLSVPSGTTETLSDETILIYDENDVLVDTITYPALDNYEVFLDSYCPAPTPPTYASAELMKTGQTTSYRTGDDGDFEAGRGASFLTLLANNPFGNTNRFTDILGGQTYATAIVIDWSTYDGVSVLGYTKALNTVNVDWNGAVDGALATSISTFTSGWRLTNVNELGNIVAYGGVTLTCLNYAPFNIQDDRLVWSSTTAPFGATTAFTLATGNGVQNVLAKTSAFCRYIACRNFTVTGTTLS